MAYSGGGAGSTATLTQIRLTSLLAANFDAGSVNIFYEG